MVIETKHLHIGLLFFHLVHRCWCVNFVVSGPNYNLRRLLCTGFTFGKDLWNLYIYTPSTIGGCVMVVVVVVVGWCSVE